jgi:hypothetical protein
MLEILGQLASGLFKVPKFKNKDGTENLDYEELSIAWRLRVAGAIVLLGGSVSMLALFAALAMGWVGSMGFARASEVNDVRADLLAERIEKVERALCMDRFDPQLITLRRELQDEYRKRKGSDYSVPNCTVLLKIQ